MKKILYILMLSALASCSTAIQMQPAQNHAEDESVDVGFGQISQKNLAFSVSEAKMTKL